MVRKGGFHGVAAGNYKPLPYRTGYDEILGNRVDALFAVAAEQDGEVTSITKKVITVTYADGTVQGYELGIKHGTVSGITIPHTIVTNLAIGAHLKMGDNITYNSGFFTPSELNPNAVVYKAGALSRIALLESSDTIEDGCVISSKLAKGLATPSTKLHAIVIDFDMMVHNLITVGSDVNPDTILCTLENTVGGLGNVKNDEAINALSRISAISPRAEVYGQISKIEVLYYGDLASMCESLQEVVTTYDAIRAKRVRALHLDDAKSGKIDEAIHVANKIVKQKQAVIKVYIDTTIAMGTGDKVVFGNQLKSTCSKVVTTPITTTDGQEVDAFFGYQSVSDRIVLSPEINGVMNTIMIELSKQMGALYTE